MGSFSSLSPCSEVSDIRSWFPSYVYESFVLDTCDGFGDSVFKEDETEEDGNGEQFGDFTTTRNLDDEKTNPNCENNNNLQPSLKMPDSAHSPSQLSDPPSIKKWFPDYEYESPILGLNDGFSGTVSKENKCEKKQGIVWKNREKEASRLEHRDIRNGKHYDGAVKYECKGFSGVSKPEKELVRKKWHVLISDSLLSSSLLSDPPSVRNWFSNYTYESPVLGTVDGFEDSITSVCVNEKVIIEDRNKENQVLNMKSSFVDYKEEKKLLCEKQNPPPDASFQSLRVDTNSSNMERKSKRKAICRKNSGESSLPKEQVDVDSLTTTWRRNYKELEGKHNSENGFVSTMKNNPNDENSRPEEILSGCCRNKSMINSAKSDIVSNSVEGRNILAERSNFQNTDVMAVTGKWRCPQKNKPINTGPPMKQLRLERWVNRQ